MLPTVRQLLCAELSLYQLDGNVLKNDNSHSTEKSYHFLVRNFTPSRETIGSSNNKQAFALAAATIGVILTAITQT